MRSILLSPALLLFFGVPRLEGETAADLLGAFGATIAFGKKPPL